jgi:hypothetical protein
MTLISGVALVLLSAAAFFYSLPRGGKLARFVGSQWEGYIVVAMIAGLGVGVMLVISGATQLLK